MSATAALVALTVCTIPRLSAPMCSFIPKCQFLPLRVCFISGSRVATRVLGRTRRRDDGCVHDGTRAQQQPPFFQQVPRRPSQESDYQFPDHAMTTVFMLT